MTTASIAPAAASFIVANSTKVADTYMCAPMSPDAAPSAAPGLAELCSAADTQEKARKLYADVRAEINCLVNDAKGANHLAYCVFNSFDAGKGVIMRALGQGL